MISPTPGRRGRVLLKVKVSRRRVAEWAGATVRVICQIARPHMPGNKHRRPGQLTGAAMTSRRLGRAPGGGGLPVDTGPPGEGGL